MQPASFRMNPSSSRFGTLALSLGLLVVTSFLWFTFRPKSTPQTPESSESASAVPGPTLPVASASVMPSNGEDPTEGAARPMIGESILRGYASPASTPENDLTLVSRLMGNALLLVKSAGDRPLSANEDWAALFLGANPDQERFLPSQHPALNARGQLVDRWGSPLHFHALGGGRHEIRSAGPDRKLWTADDLHRNADGTFRKGTNLVGGDLLDIAGDRERR